MVTQEFFMLATAHWLALVSPGPDFLLLLRNALRHGRRNGIGTSLGIACANGAYILLALAGFSILQHSPALLLVMKLLASAYLAYIGLAFMRAGRKVQSVLGTMTPRQEGSGAGFLSGLCAGFLSAGLNPKNGLFYLGLFTLMVDAKTGMLRKSLYGLWMFGAVFSWDALLVLAISNVAVAARISRYFGRAEWMAGVLLLTASASIAVLSMVSSQWFVDIAQAWPPHVP